MQLGICNVNVSEEYEIISYVLPFCLLYRVLIFHVFIAECCSESYEILLTISK